jgi:hypothetical protein
VPTPNFVQATLSSCLLAITFATATPQTPTPTPVPKESFYSMSPRAVIRLEHCEEIKKEGQPAPTTQIVPDGTAFFVQSADGVFAVTAGHVASSPYNLHSRIPAARTSTGQTQILQLSLPQDRWIHHPDAGSPTRRGVDIAVMKIPQPRNLSLAVLQYCPENCPAEAYNQLPQKDPEPPLQVLVMGFPLDIGLQLVEQRPMGRQGLVALQSEEEFMKIEDKFVDKRAFLVDAKIFGGNSGSPILETHPFSPQIFLVGLAFASNPTLDFAIAEPVS